MKAQLHFCIVILLALSGPLFAGGSFSDSFNDNSLDTSHWVVGGGARGTWTSDMLGTGPWTAWQTEGYTAGNPDGRLQLGVQGPGSGNTFGGEAWVRTSHNYNDGNAYLMNFTWQAEVVDWHFNHYHIQITDGYIADPENNHWIDERPDAGTTDLLWGTNSHGDPVRYGAYSSTQAKSTWSLTIAPSGFASLYDGPDGPSGTGNLLRTEILNLADPWYVRFFVNDATSAGFPAGEAHLNLYDMTVVPEPATLSLLALGGLTILRRRKSA
ncbi:MAG: PEP-CTERM sorting domain-containing protein [Phycisphaerae bacterium]